MKACQTDGNLRSPHSYAEDDDDTVCNVEAGCEGIVDCIKKSVTSNPAKVKWDMGGTIGNTFFQKKEKRYKVVIPLK